MLLVKTYIDKSPVHGLGLFAAEPIAKGQEVSRFVPGYDSICFPEQYAQLPPLAQRFLRCYGFPLETLAGQLGRPVEDLRGGWALEVDNMRFCNHSDTPNLSTDGPVRALCDIQPGDEMFQCYFECNPQYDFLDPVSQEKTRK
ncbi:MAG: SET domain-containing protein [Myxococcales bacterium]|nr:SET domain-containing protein [Myxococcales bacterium]